MAKLSSALWREMMHDLRERHAPICRQWFEELEPGPIDSGLLEIYTKNSIQQNYLQRKCLEPFTEAAQSVTGALVAVRFVSDEQRNERRANQQQRAGGNGQRPAPVRIAPQQRTAQTEFEDQIMLIPDYSFTNFVTGPNNRLAYAAAVAVAEQPGTAYNPLFIHGGVGLGKTHILQSICQAILEGEPNANICYLSCDAFMNQYIECVRAGTMNEFRHRYRDVDVMVIDDIHFLGNREQTQEEFFHTFNALYQGNKQIVLSSDSPPSEIPQLEERLVSRFQWGLVAQITKPSYETRVAIVKSKMSLRGIDAPEDVICYIASKVNSNTRELEGAITTIQGHAQFDNRAIDLSLAQEALGEPPLQSQNAQVTLQNIIDLVTGFYNVKLSDLQSKRRHKSITMPRQVCMYLARKHTRFSLQEIGGYFGGRDHTTVMHSIRTVEQRVGEEPQFAGEVEQLDDRITHQVS